MLKRLNITLQCCIKNEAVSVTHQSVTTMQLWINLALALARGFWKSVYLDYILTHYPAQELKVESMMTTTKIMADDNH